jgi:hypothetical protein
MFIIASRVLTPILVPTVMLIEVSMFITTGILTTIRTSLTIPHTDPIAKPDKPRAKNRLSHARFTEVEPNEIITILLITVVIL